MTTTGWTPTAGEFPFAPANGTVMSAFTGVAFDLRWDDPSTLNTGPSTPSSRASLTVTVSGSPSVLAAATGTVTVLTVPVPAGSTLVVGGQAVTSVAGAPVAPDLPIGFAPWTNAFDASDAPHWRWFTGARTNGAFNEVDRHVLAGHGAETALIF